MSKRSESEIIEKLKQIDTPTISNVVATYPGDELCLELYDAWHGRWYTDTTIQCMFPELGARVGHVATVVFALKHAAQLGLDQWALPDHIEETKKPTVLVAQQIFPPAITKSAPLFGGIMSIQYKALGVVGVVTDGPIRDLDEIRETGLQYCATGVTPAHGDFVEVAVGVPVTVGGLLVKPGDIVHMDKNGVVKFPSNKMVQVLENAQKMLEREAKERRLYQDPKFSLSKWKKIVDKESKQEEV